MGLLKVRGFGASPLLLVSFVVCWCFCFASGAVCAVFFCFGGCFHFAFAVACDAFFCFGDVLGAFVLLLLLSVMFFVYLLWCVLVGVLGAVLKCGREKHGITLG